MERLLLVHALGYGSIGLVAGTLLGALFVGIAYQPFIFMLIGLQLKPILQRLSGAALAEYLGSAAIVCAGTREGEREARIALGRIGQPDEESAGRAAEPCSTAATRWSCCSRA